MAKTKKNPVREATDDALDSLNGQTIEMPGALVARVYTVAAMSNWTPEVEDPFESIEGDVEVDFRIVAEAYLVAIMAGWRPEKDDPVALKLLELGLLKES